ncbi:type II toxin-antitoxin system RelE/ParE family toxin [Seongchinamella sediminis]|uniref:Type II toxin-antitoxin system RelE/ParE family toxin n=1 Tax=Seongchinamella sediminis TaxID=2283635 RepID=A0A3L7E413_9GAMM|nr:type II toxin-antitoxin system RelE/ParE family toxin [Seongchinamella sediminis]RLQ23735.1 type II toxin-antitoxin system RelE/ParE family toxin [Seongchinamella sediminis]
MDYSVVWSGDALDDIDALAKYIARDSLFYAQQVVTEVMAAGDTLAGQPTRGRVVPELKEPSIRERFIYSYRLIYEIRDAEREVHMLAVLHGKRLLSSVARFQEQD